MLAANPDVFEENEYAYSPRSSARKEVVTGKHPAREKGVIGEP